MIRGKTPLDNCGTSVKSHSINPHVTVGLRTKRRKKGNIMANIWRVYEGKEPTIGGPWVHLSVSEVVALFDLRPDDFVSDLAVTPRFGNVKRDLAYAGYKHVIVEIERTEGQKAKWNPGFYETNVTPKEAFGRLILQAVVSELGDDNVVRLDFEPTTDSLGRDALKITVVITPGATGRIDGGAVLDALAKVQERLREMGEDRIPIIEYATEAELEMDDAAQS